MMRKYIRKLEQAARKEEWEFVDRKMLVLKNRKSLVDWARLYGYKSKNANVRDLAMTVLQSTNFRMLSPAVRQTTLLKAYNVMIKDKNPYARYRAAFSLANNLRILKKAEKEKVIKTLEEAVKDEAVKEIARKYLRKIK